MVTRNLSGPAAIGARKDDSGTNAIGAADRNVVPVFLDHTVNANPARPVGPATLFAFSGGDRFTVVPGDPVLTDTPYTYEMAATATNRGTTLTWTYPDNVAQPSASSSVTNVNRMFLQRSSTDQLDNPLAPAFNNFFLATGPLGVPIEGNPAPESGWTTIASWVQGQDFPATYFDQTVADPIFNYRLILYLNGAGEGLQVLGEIDWNVVSVIASYALSGSNLNNTTSLHLTAPASATSISIYRSDAGGPFNLRGTIVGTSSTAYDFTDDTNGAALPLVYRAIGHATV